ESTGSLDGGLAITGSSAGVPSALEWVSASSQSMASNGLPPLPPIHRSMWRSLGPPSGPCPFQSAVHSSQESSMMKYFFTRGTHTLVPGDSSAVAVAKVIGSANVPLPPAVLWIFGKEMSPPGGPARAA